MSKQRKQLEQVLELLINEEFEAAEELLHDVFVAKARQIHENLMMEDDELLEDGWLQDYEMGSGVDEQEFYGPEDFMQEGGDEEDYDDEQGDVPGEQDTGPDEYDSEDEDENSDDSEGSDDEMSDDDDSDEDVKDKIDDMLADLEEIKAAIEQLSGGEDDMGDAGDMGGEEPQDMKMAAEYSMYESDDEEDEDEVTEAKDHEDEEDDQMDEADDSQNPLSNMTNQKSGTYGQNQGMPRGTDVEKTGTHSSGQSAGTKQQQKGGSSADFSDKLAAHGGGYKAKPANKQMKDPAGSAKMEPRMPMGESDDMYEEIDLDEYEDLGEGYLDNFHSEVPPARNDEAGAGKFVGKEKNVQSPIPQKKVTDRVGGNAHEIKSDQHSGYEREAHPSFQQKVGSKKPTNIRKKHTDGLKKERATNFENTSQGEVGSGGEKKVQQNTRSPLSPMGQKRAKQGIGTK